MKSLSTSLRENKRYLLVRGKNLRQDIEKAILDFAGVIGLSKTCLNFINVEKDFAIISINRESINLVRSSICVWHEKMFVERVSGTLNGLKNN